MIKSNTLLRQLHLLPAVMPVSHLVQLVAKQRDGLVLRPDADGAAGSGGANWHLEAAQHVGVELGHMRQPVNHT